MELLLLVIAKTCSPHKFRRSCGANPAGSAAASTAATLVFVFRHGRPQERNQPDKAHERAAENCAYDVAKRVGTKTKELVTNQVQLVAGRGLISNIGQ